MAAAPHCDLQKQHSSACRVLPLSIELLLHAPTCLLLAISSSSSNSPTSPLIAHRASFLPYSHWEQCLLAFLLACGTTPSSLKEQ